MGKRVRVLVSDSVIVNTGDAAILSGNLAYLRSTFDDPELRLHVQYFEQAAALYPGLPLARSLLEATKEYPPALFWRVRRGIRYRWAVRFAKAKLGFLARVFVSRAELEALQDYLWADAIVSCGGSFLTDTYRLDPVLAGFDVALSLNKDISVLGQSIGPFQRADTKRAVSQRLARFATVVVRDERSEGVAADMGVPRERLFHCPDFAFLLEAEPALGRFRRGLGPPKVAVSVRRWVFPGSDDPESLHRRYVSEMARFVERLVDVHRCDVVFISTCQGVPDYAFHDEAMADDVVACMSTSAGARIDRRHRSPAEFLSALDDIDVMIGTRMHACILSLIKNIPVVNICYEFKSKELMRALGFPEFVVDIDAVSATTLETLYETIMGDYEGYTRSVAAGVRDRRARFEAPRAAIAASGQTGSRVREAR